MTTASSASAIPFRSNRFLQILLALFLVVWLWSAIRPAIPEDWLLENLLVFVLLALLAATYPRLTFSDLSYSLIFMLLFLHEFGAHYQYSDVPLGEWLKPFLQTERNHYDRLVHFAFGLLFAYPQREILLRKAELRAGWLNVLPIFTTLALSASYEMIEAVVASIVDPTDAAAFLGSQGDQWDSQEDMFMALSGATVAMLAVWIANQSRKPKQ
ncbi:MAG TPA: DUF2238 domain-containing protein [Bryobacteraceae bacterium]|nr:DUF2238 domain-containing protein [Bryobacteraceae bacterium]